MEMAAGWSLPACVAWKAGKSLAVSREAEGTAGLCVNVVAVVPSWW